MTMNPGLHIPETMGVGELSLGQQEQHQIHSRWYTSQMVEDELTSWGFAPLSHPGITYPTITPELLSGPDGHRYTQAYQQVSAWLSYSMNLKSRIQSRILEINNEMGRIELEIKKFSIQAAKDRGDKKPTKDLLEDLCMAHPRWEQLLLEKQMCEQRKLGLDSHVARQERDYKLLSRQIEIRKEDRNSGNIGNNLGHRGSPQQGHPPGMYPQQGQR